MILLCSNAYVQVAVPLALSLAFGHGLLCVLQGVVRIAGHKSDLMSCTNFLVCFCIAMLGVR